MAIRVNTNIFSLFINRNLARSGDRLDEAYRRLSSGQKINSAGDDPAGLANSNALRAKIAGLQQNVVNGNEGINLINVAESSLSNVTDILQRLRELAVQAASSTVSDSDRALSQKEVDSLLAEIQRIGTTANYNDKPLLDGSFVDLRLQVGTRAGQSIAVTIDDTRTTALGSVARVTGALSVDNLPIAGTGDLTINGVTVPLSGADGISIVDDSASGIAKAAAINSVSHLTKVTAKANPTVTSGSGIITPGGLDGAGSSLVINGVNIGLVNFLDRDSDSVLRDRINSLSTRTGVTASLGSSGELVLTAQDGRNVQIQASGAAVTSLGLPNGTTVSRGTVTLSSSSTIQVGGTTGRIGLTAGQSTTFVDPTTAIKNLTLTTEDSAQDALQSIDIAMQQILARRADLGALQSRLDQTLDDLMLNIENLTNADSSIRDADFAAETANMTQAQIIQQAGLAILSQANVIPTKALSLLQQQ